MKRTLFLYLLPLFVLAGCNMEKEIEVVLPEHEPQLVVECYLEDGLRFEATILESSSYFDAPTPPVVPSAEVYITFGGQRLKLKYSPGINNVTRRYYTHYNHQLVKLRPGDVYSIEVVDANGRKVTGYTTVLPRVPIESVEWKFNDKDKAYILTTYQDDAATRDFYRYMTHRDSLQRGAYREFATSDELTNGKRTSYGSGYDFEEGDTLILSLYHIEEQYYNFLRSVDDAKNANGNPFAQPAKVTSSVQGGIGIFTNLAYDRDTVIISRPIN